MKQRSLTEWRKSTTLPPRSIGKLKPVESVYQAIGAIMVEMRGRLRLSQMDLGIKLGWNAATISRIECGVQRVALHDLPRLALALKLPVLDLFPKEWLAR